MIFHGSLDFDALEKGLPHLDLILAGDKKNGIELKLITRFAIEPVDFDYRSFLYLVLFTFNIN